MPHSSSVTEMNTPTSTSPQGRFWLNSPLIIVDIKVACGAGSDEDWRREIAFWKDAGVTHVTAHTTYTSDHHKRISGHSAADHLAAITRYREAVADLL